MFSAIQNVLQKIVMDGLNDSQHGDVDPTYTTIIFSEFVFVFILVKEVMRITDAFCPALQQ